MNGAWVVSAVPLIIALVCTTPAHGEEFESGHEYEPNTVGVFLGATSEGRRDRAATLGIEYERRLSREIGIGGIYEHAFGDLDFDILAVAVAYHSGPWKLYAAPGVEITNERSTEFLLRLGVEYGFHVQSLEISPQVDLDLVDGDEVLVIGATIAYGF